jgi:hypothetical protein
MTIVGRSAPEKGHATPAYPPDTPTPDRGHRFHGRGTLVIDRVFDAIGRIRRASGTTDLAVFDHINGTMTALYRERRLDILEALRDGKVTPLEMLAAHGEGREPRRANRAPNLVYVIRAIYSGHLKIGIARDPVERLWRLQTSNWEDLRLLLTMPGGRKLEQELHERFARYRMAREWFRHSDEIDLWLLETRQLPHVTRY